MPGGCKLILVIAHFECLITSEFKIPLNIKPRLPLWSTSLLKSFIALDSMHGEKNEFGRLPMKHISSTPFNDSMNDFAVELPEVILQYIDNKFPSFQDNLEKSLLQASSQRFWETLVTNYIPTLRTYIDDVKCSFSKKSATTRYSIKQETKSLPATSSPVTSGIAELCVPKSVGDLDQAINSLLNSDEFLHLKNDSNVSAPTLKEHSKAAFDLFVQDCTDPEGMNELANCGVLFPKILPTFEELFKIEKMPTDITIEHLNPLEVLQDYVRSQLSTRVPQNKQKDEWINEKFSITQFKFVANNQSYKGSKLYCLQEEVELNSASLNKISTLSSQPSSSKTVPATKTATYHTTNPSSAALIPNTNFLPLATSSHGKSPFLYSSSKIRTCQNNPAFLCFLPA
ncbi:uncharacterized protein [Aegilops tauschii subsp. strangulata]|uniref:uncharacterized protein isoform X3 n=1 Tax=Aegilops tauschii subsp. strangulata TaxID=200361 RepID=UPI001E1CA7CD|nr:uncharacterized protein LOC109740985 isoform X3 [Aegilops tauschii subsp. strangulata]